MICTNRLVVNTLLNASTWTILIVTGALAAIIALKDAHRTSGHWIQNAANKPNAGQVRLARGLDWRIFRSEVGLQH
jgi:hypothetical protein